VEGNKKVGALSPNALPVATGLVICVVMQSVAIVLAVI